MAMFTCSWLEFLAFYKFISEITKCKLSMMTSSSYRNTNHVEDVTFIIRNHVSGVGLLLEASTFVHHIQLNTTGIDGHYFSWVLYPFILYHNTLSDLNTYLLKLLHTFLSFLILLSFLIFLSFLVFLYSFIFVFLSFLIFVFLFFLLTLTLLGGCAWRCGSILLICESVHLLWPPVAVNESEGFICSPLW